MHSEDEYHFMLCEVQNAFLTVCHSHSLRNSARTCIQPAPRDSSPPEDGVRELKTIKSFSLPPLSFYSLIVAESHKPMHRPLSPNWDSEWNYKYPPQSVQSLSHVQLFATPWIAARQASLSITNSQSSPKLMSIESVRPSSHLILCHPLLLLPLIPPSIRVFSNESVLHIRWPKYWSFSFINSSNEYSGLISFMMDWLDLLTVQGTLKSLLQHHSSKASILRRSAFFIVQLSHPYMTTGKKP